MTDSLQVYLCDHLMGAQFAISLLQDLSQQSLDPTVASFSAEIVREIEADRDILRTYQERIGGTESPWKNMSGWVAQKASRFKLQLSEPMGLFEAFEMLALGVLGKLALWEVLKSLRETNVHPVDLDLERLIDRARKQHFEIEAMRLRLALQALI
ncbi:MAG: hypothetical protein U0903_03090 [Planctomycetales bacterium]